jgi:hypothetical protein
LLVCVPLSERRRCISVDVLGVDVSWGTVKNVIKRYQYGKIGYDHYIQKDQNLPNFQYITDHDNCKGYHEIVINFMRLQIWETFGHSIHLSLWVL